MAKRAGKASHCYLLALNTYRSVFDLSWPILVLLAFLLLFSSMFVQWMTASVIEKPAMLSTDELMLVRAHFGFVQLVFTLFMWLSLTSVRAGKAYRWLREGSQPAQLSTSLYASTCPSFPCLGLGQLEAIGWQWRHTSVKISESAL